MLEYILNSSQLALPNGNVALGSRDVIRSLVRPLTVSTISTLVWHRLLTTELKVSQINCPNSKISQMSCGRSDGSAFDWVDPSNPSSTAPPAHCSYWKLGTYSGIWDLMQLTGSVVLFSLENWRSKTRLSFTCCMVGFFQVAWIFLAPSGALCLQSYLWKHLAQFNNYHMTYQCTGPPTFQDLCLCFYLII